MKTLENVHAKLASKKGRKLAAQDVKIMMTTIELRKWVNAHRKTAMAAKRANAKQIKRKALEVNAQDQGRLQGHLPLAMQVTAKAIGDNFSFDCV